MLENVTLVGGEQILAHTKDACEGKVCCIHNPSDHHMRDWPQHWRDDKGVMERICPHGIGHPDPDDLHYLRTTGLSYVDETHGCDGCCHG